MNKLKSCLRRLIKRFTSKVPPTQRSAPVVKAPKSELQQDWDLFYSIPYLDEIQGKHVRDDLRRKYAEPALKLLRKQLKAQPGKATKDDALLAIKKACEAVNSMYPLDWSVPTDGHEVGSTTRHNLASHYIWLNPNGAYCIENFKTSIVLICKPAADGSEFEKPQRSGNSG